MSIAEPMVKYSEREISAALESYIIEHELAEGVQLSTALQLAEKYGVSTKTIHRAIGRLVRKGMVYRVRGSGTYVRSHGCPAGALQVGLFLWKQQSEMSVLDQAAFDVFTDDLVGQIERQGHRVEILHESIFNKAASRINQVPLDKFDVVIAAAGFLEVAEERLRRFRGHVILINDDIIHPGPWHQVIYDYHAGFGQALEYLRQIGVKKIFVPGALGVDICGRRYRALEEEALRLGYRQDDLTFYQGNCGPLKMMVMAGRDCGKYYLDHFSRDTAIVSVSDYLSVGIVDAFREHGVKPGRDVRLVSYDNLESRLPDHQLDLNFTAITHPLKEFAAGTVRMLNDLTRQKKPEEMYRVYVIPARDFVIRDSA